METKRGAWAEELLGVLWAYRTTVKTPTGETLFAMAYRRSRYQAIESSPMTKSQIIEDWKRTSICKRKGGKRKKSRLLPSKER